MHILKVMNSLALCHSNHWTGSMIEFVFFVMFVRKKEREGNGGRDGGGGERERDRERDRETERQRQRGVCVCVEEIGGWVNEP